VDILASEIRESFQSMQVPPENPRDSRSWDTAGSCQKVAENFSCREQVKALSECQDVGPGGGGVAIAWDVGGSGDAEGPIDAVLVVGDIAPADPCPLSDLGVRCGCEEESVEEADGNCHCACGPG
jgi:hypothetical protein